MGSFAWLRQVLVTNLLAVLFGAYFGSGKQIEKHIPNSMKKDDDQKQTQRKTLYQLLGKLPDYHRPVTVKIILQEETEDFFIQKLLLDLNGRELVPAYFTRPKKLKSKIPVVLFNHSHFGQYQVGKNEFINGRKEM